MKKSVDVVGAVILAEGRILCAQRGGGPLSGLWEFPGGKVESSETPADALVREIHEELCCLVIVGEEITTTRHEYEFATVNLTTFYCTVADGRPSLTEHTAMRWVAPTELRALDWAPADVPAVTLIEERFNRMRT